MSTNRNTMLPIGHLENGQAASYDFNISGILKAAWEKVTGFKVTIWKGILVYALVAIGLYLISQLIIFISKQTAGISPNTDSVSSILASVRLLLLYPVSVGLLVMGVKRMVNQPVQTKLVLAYYKDIIPLIGVLITSSVISSIVIFIGSLLVILATQFNFPILVEAILFILGIPFFLGGIYLFFGYLFAPLLLVEKRLSIWQSLEVSRKAVTQHWFKLFFLTLITGVIVILSCIALFIGLIWTIPWSYCVWGMLYRTMFGVENV